MATPRYLGRRQEGRFGGPSQAGGPVDVSGMSRWHILRLAVTGVVGVAADHWRLW
jgi:hypothetical protein